METIQTTYLGNLRTEATHIQSGNKLITDAPSDNNGKGEAFSPTDLLATSLGSCIFTIMGIKAEQHNFSIEGAKAKSWKIMNINPRRVGEIKIEFDFSMCQLSDKQKKLLQNVVKTCPVSLSVHSEIKQNISFKF